MSRICVWGSDDPYVEIYQVGKAGWSASFEVKTKFEDVSVIIEQVSWVENETGVSETVNIDVEAAYNSPASFTVSSKSYPFKEYTVYWLHSSYELYIGGVYEGTYGFSFSFETTSRYEAQGIYTAPIIYSISKFDGFASMDVLVTLNVSATYCDHYLYITVTDSEGNTHEFDNSNVYIQSITDGELITYVAEIDREKISYGRISVLVTTVATEKNDSNGDGETGNDDYADVKSETAVFYRHFRFNSLDGLFSISAEEWNAYNNAFATAIADSGHGSYRYDEVLSGQEITLDLLNQPINGYYRAFGWFFRDDVIPRMYTHFGKVPDGINAITAYEFFTGLEDMLNSFYVQEAK